MYRACPICSLSETTVFTMRAERYILICRECRHIWHNQIPDAIELERFYAGEYTSLHQQREGQEGGRDYYRSHAIELEKINDDLLAIADIGCSIPVFLREAAGVSATRIGVDISEDAREAGQAWGIQMMSPDAFISTVPDGSLDVLRYSHTLEHLVDPMGALLSHIPKLRPGGLVYITQPNFPVMQDMATHVELHDSVWPAHLHFFNPLSMLAMCKRAGLTMKRFATIDGDRAALERYQSCFDMFTSAERLKDIAGITETGRGTFAGWPFFAGQNSACYAYLD